MLPNQKPIPFINVRTQENRTPTGRRTSTPAKRAAIYYAYGNQHLPYARPIRSGRLRR
jgi:hypothetical protein